MSYVDIEQHIKIDIAIIYFSCQQKLLQKKIYVKTTILFQKYFKLTKKIIMSILNFG
jgi:predicted transposase YdaD